MKIVKTKVVMTDSIEAVEIDKILLQVNNFKLLVKFNKISECVANKINDFWNSFKTMRYCWSLKG